MFVARCFISRPPSSKTKPVIMCLVRSRCGAVGPGCFTSSFITLIITIHPYNINTGCEIPSARVSTTDQRAVCLQEASLTTAFFFHLLLFRLLIVRYFYSKVTSTTYVFVGSSQSPSSLSPATKLTRTFRLQDSTQFRHFPFRTVCFYISHPSL